MSENIIDVNENEFEDNIVGASSDKLVVVDFLTSTTPMAGESVDVFLQIQNNANMPSYNAQGLLSSTSNLKILSASDLNDAAKKIVDSIK